MKVPPDTICSVKTCKRIFCCENCRKKHEEKTHAIVIKSKNVNNRTSSSQLSDSMYVLCPICSNQPFVLHHEMYPEEVLTHIKQNHLPLRCQKCAKIYTKIEELREFSKCLKSNLKSEIENCVPNDRSKYVPAIKISAVKKCEPIELHTISTQTSPMLAGESEPNYIKNLLWHSQTHKTTQEINFSSIKNLSLSGSNSSHCRQIEMKGKLVRTTSTPVHCETQNLKPREQTFNATGGQVSSIYNSGCETENEKHSPVLLGTIERPASVLTVPPQADSINVYRKFGGRQKIAAVTPLRQVMSKSIQKAFAEHGLPSTSDHKMRHLNDASTALTNMPLDLRLSPALRRCQSDSFNGVKNNGAKSVTSSATSKSSEYLSSAKRTTKNSLVIKRAHEFRSSETAEKTVSSDSALSSSSNSSVYKSCQSIEIITSTELNESEIHNNIFCGTEASDQLCDLKNIHQQKSPRQSAAINTPINRLSGLSIAKKLINFETPNVKNNSSSEKFYTPKGGSPADCSTVSKNLVPKPTEEHDLIRFSPMRRPSIHECAQSTAYSHYEIDYDSSEEVFFTPSNESSKKIKTSEKSTQHGNGFIWSFMSSVMQKGTRFLDNKRLSFYTDEKMKDSLIKRCSSIAGSLVRSNSLLDEKQFQSMKRKRTNTFDNQTSPLSSVRSMDPLPQNFDSSSSSKRFRIQGRKPIERMRNTSL